jgi:catechol 2,3-dioxygenase-like lactoylglutathione lyase family enzyme
MALELYMIGLMTRDMTKSLEFYRCLGIDIPSDSEGKTHVEVKMSGGLTFFLDSNPARWDPGFTNEDGAEPPAPSSRYPSILEFYLKDRAVLDAKYKELTGFGYRSRRAPYVTSFGMYFALIYDPDGNTILLSADIN